MTYLIYCKRDTVKKALLTPVFYASDHPIPNFPDWEIQKAVPILGLPLHVNPTRWSAVARTMYTEGSHRKLSWAQHESVVVEEICG